jgi:hypothetical protein
MTFDMTAADAVLKDYYTRDKLQEQSYYDQPWYSIVSKNGEQAGGRRFIQPVEFANPGGASADFATAMTNETSSSYEDFQIPQTLQYQRVTVKHQALLSSRNADEAFQPAFKEFDKGLRSLGEKLGKRLYRTASGSIGQIANSTVTTTVLTLADKADVFNFFLGQKLKASATDGSATYAGVGTVSAVDNEAGTVTLTQNIDTAFTAPATTAFFYQQGDEQNGGTAVCLAGLEDWLPGNSTTRATKLAASFNGVTRSADGVRLGGVYLNGTAMALDEVLIKLSGKVTKHGGRADTYLMNPETLSDLMLLENSRRFLMQDASVNVKSPSTGETIIGFSGMRAMVGGRSVTIVPDRNCPSSRIYALQLNTWTLWHAGELPCFLGESFGAPMLKLAESQDALEARIGAYLNLGCNAPGWNGVAQVTPST